MSPGARVGLAFKCFIFCQKRYSAVGKTMSKPVNNITAYCTKQKLWILETLSLSIMLQKIEYLVEQKWPMVLQTFRPPWYSLGFYDGCVSEWVSEWVRKKILNFYLQEEGDNYSSEDQLYIPPKLYHFVFYVELMYYINTA